MYIYIYDSCVFAVLKKLLPTNAACEDIKKKMCLLIFAKICSTYFTRKMQRKNPSTDPRYYSSWPTMCWHQKPLPLNQWKKRLVNLRWLEVWIGWMYPPLKTNSEFTPENCFFPSGKGDSELGNHHFYGRAVSFREGIPPQPRMQSLLEG